MRQFGLRDYGSAVMYEPGKILYVGGGDPPTDTAEIIDLNQPNPTWTYTDSMAAARRQLNATLLPTGDVLVTGGTSGSGFNDLVGAVRTAELWNPTTGKWTVGPDFPNTDSAGDSFAVLLPNGNALVLGNSGALYEFDGTKLTIDPVRNVSPILMLDSCATPTV